MDKVCDSKIKQSPGILSPAETCTISPGTTSSRGISLSLPSRKIRALTSTIASNLAIASAAPRSCQKPNNPLNKTIAKIIRELMVSPRKLERMAAPIKIKIMGLLNWFSNREKV